MCDIFIEFLKLKIKKLKKKNLYRRKNSWQPIGWMPKMAARTWPTKSTIYKMKYVRLMHVPLLHSVTLACGCSNLSIFLTLLWLHLYMYNVYTMMKSFSFINDKLKIYQEIFFKNFANIICKKKSSLLFLRFNEYLSSFLCNCKNCLHDIWLRILILG